MQKSKIKIVPCRFAARNNFYKIVREQSELKNFACPNCFDIILMLLYAEKTRVYFGNRIMSKSNSKQAGFLIFDF
jgi:ribosomal protein S27AE